jgi:hypothetical protein
MRIRWTIRASVDDLIAGADPGGTGGVPVSHNARGDD